MRLNIIVLFCLLSFLSVLGSVSAVEDVKNSSGVYIGAFTGGSGDLSQENISSFNEKTGKPHSVFVRYVNINDSKNPQHMQWASDVVKNGAMPMFVYDPGEGLNSINNSKIDYFATKCSELNETVFIVYGHEMNLRFYSWGNQPDLYKQKFKEAAEIFHSKSSNIQMCWVPNQNWGYPWGGTDYGDGYTEFYPDGTGTYGDYVDFVGINFYEKDWDEDNIVPSDMFQSNINGGSDPVNFYQTFAVGKNKPMIISETSAFDPNLDPTTDNIINSLDSAAQTAFKNSWVSQVYNKSTISTEFPKLKIICYFDTSKIEGIDTAHHQFYSMVTDYKLPETLYKTLISDSYFIGAKNTLISSNPTNNAWEVPINKDIKLTFNRPIKEGIDLNSIVLKNSEGAVIQTTKSISGNILTIKSVSGLVYGTKYIINIPKNSLYDLYNSSLTKNYSSSFTTLQIRNTNLKIQNKGKSAIYFKYYLTIKYPEGKIVSKYLKGKLYSGKSTTINLGKYPAGTIIKLREYVYNKSKFKRTVRVTNTLYVAGKSPYTQLIVAYSVKGSPGNLYKYPVYKLKTFSI